MRDACYSLTPVLLIYFVSLSRLIHHFTACAWLSTTLRARRSSSTPISSLTPSASRRFTDSKSECWYFNKNEKAEWIYMSAIFQIYSIYFISHARRAIYSLYAKGKFIYMNLLIRKRAKIPGSGGGSGDIYSSPRI